MVLRTFSCTSLGSDVSVNCSTSSLSLPSSRRYRWAVRSRCKIFLSHRFIFVLEKIVLPSYAIRIAVGKGKGGEFRCTSLARISREISENEVHYSENFRPSFCVFIFTLVPFPLQPLAFFYHLFPSSSVSIHVSKQQFWDTGEIVVISQQTSAMKDFESSFWDDVCWIVYFLFGYLASLVLFFVVSRVFFAFLEPITICMYIREYCYDFPIVSLTMKATLQRYGNARNVLYSHDPFCFLRRNHICCWPLYLLLVPYVLYIVTLVSRQRW